LALASIVIISYLNHSPFRSGAVVCFDYNKSDNLVGIVSAEKYLRDDRIFDGYHGWVHKSGVS